MSNQKRVFDHRFRHADFPANFWLGKHQQRNQTKPKESGNMTNKIVKKIKHYPGSELKNKPFSQFQQEILSNNNGLPMKGREVALHFYQY